MSVPPVRGLRRRRRHQHPVAHVLAFDSFEPGEVVKAPRRFASESMRNCPEATTFWPTLSPSRISERPPCSAPTRTSAGRKCVASSATITTLRVPVLITASVGTVST